MAGSSVRTSCARGLRTRQSWTSSAATSTPAASVAAGSEGASAAASWPASRCVRARDASARGARIEATGARDLHASDARAAPSTNAHHARFVGRIAAREDRTREPLAQPRVPLERRGTCHWHRAPRSPTADGVAASPRLDGLAWPLLYATAMNALSPPPSTSVTCTTDGPDVPKPSPSPAPLGPVPAEFSQAREARDATTLSLLARHADPRVRAAVGGNLNAPEEALTALADDPEGPVIAAVSRNPALSDALFVDLYERPRPRLNINLYDALYDNGERGAYALSFQTFARALLYLFGGVFLLVDLFTFAFGATDKGRPVVPPQSPIALRALCGALVALLLARALAPFVRLTVAKLRARSVLPQLAVWIARVAVVALLALQIHSCATW